MNIELLKRTVPAMREALCICWFEKRDFETKDLLLFQQASK